MNDKNLKNKCFLWKKYRFQNKKIWESKFKLKFLINFTKTVKK